MRMRMRTCIFEFKTRTYTLTARVTKIYGRPGARAGARLGYLRAHVHVLRARAHQRGRGRRRPMHGCRVIMIMRGYVRAHVHVPRVHAAVHMHYIPLLAFRRAQNRQDDRV